MKCSKCGYEYLQEIMSKPMTGDNGIQIMYRCGMCGEIEVEEHLRVKQMIPKSIDKSIDDFKRAKFQAEDEITQIIRKLFNEYPCEIDIDVRFITGIQLWINLVIHLNIKHSFVLYFDDNE